MKLISSIAVHVAIAVLLGVGMVLMVQGKPALLIAGGIGYCLLLGKVGCASH